MGLSGGWYQVDSRVSWKDNKPSGPVGNNGEIQGFGERYRVRIMGYYIRQILMPFQIRNYHGHISCILSLRKAQEVEVLSHKISLRVILSLVSSWMVKVSDSQSSWVFLVIMNIRKFRKISQKQDLFLSVVLLKDQLSRYSVKVDRGDTVVPQSGAKQRKVC